MINVLIPIVKENKKYIDLLKKLEDNNDVAIFIGVRESLYTKFKEYESEKVNISVYEDNADKECILNSLHDKTVEGSILVLRKPITIEEFEKFINKEEDIVVCKSERNKIMEILFSLWQKILKMLLGVNMYPGDTSAVYFSEEITPVISQTGNLSFTSRIDRWRGVEKGCVDVRGEKEKVTIDKKVIIRDIIISLICLSVATIVTTLVCVFAKVSIIIGLLIFCLDAISFSVILIMIVLIIFNCMVGKKNFQNAFELVKNIDEYGEEIEDDKLDNTNNKEGEIND